MKPAFKPCNCPLESWEVIVVDRDEQFEERSTIYYHCDECGGDYAIVDFYTGEILYLNPQLEGTKEYLNIEHLRIKVSEDNQIGNLRMAAGQSDVERRDQRTAGLS